MTTPHAAAAPRWTLGDRLRKAREHARFTQTELAQTTGISRASIVSYETGRTVPTRPVLLSWALATGVPLDWLSAEEDDLDDSSEFSKSSYLTPFSAVLTA